MTGFYPRKLSNFNSITKAWRERFSALAGQTASTGSDQATGVALVNSFNRFSTVGTAGDSATLPAAKPGAVIWIKNGAASNSMDVFPASGESINALSNDAAFALAATKGNFFVCTLAGKWDTVII
jgi:hypothetical protein